MKKSSQANLKLETAHYDYGIVEMIDNTDSCLCCSTKLKYLDKNKRRNKGYCSLKCYYNKPPKMAYIEYEYNNSARQVIIDMLNSGKSKNCIAGLLGIGRQLLYQYMVKLEI